MDELEDVKKDLEQLKEDSAAEVGKLKKKLERVIKMHSVVLKIWNLQILMLI